VYDGIAIIGVIESSLAPVIITCYGHAMSMGLYIFLSSDYRRMHKLSTLMYHEIHDDMGDNKLQATKLSIKEGDRLQKLLDDYIVDKTNITLSKLDKHHKHQSEWFITAKEAVKLGIVKKENIF
jgi:ATP-dependent protease ClpP protease subunit